MIRHRLEVERALEAHHVATRVLDRLAERVFVRVFRPGDGVAEYVGVERPACMEMGLAEIDVPLGVTLAEAGRSGENADPESKRRHRNAAANGSPQCHDVTPALSSISRLFDASVVIGVAERCSGKNWLRSRYDENRQRQKRADRRSDEYVCLQPRAP